MDDKHEIVLYQINDSNVCVSVFYKDETFWLTQKAMSELFDCSSDNISQHLKNIYKEEELDENSTTEIFSVVQKEGKRDVRRNSMSRLNRLVTMFIDYAELMAEDEILMSMKDWVDQTNQFLSNNRREVLTGKGRVSHEAAIEKATKEYDIFRVRQDREYVSEFDKHVERYLKGE